MELKLVVLAGAKQGLEIPLKKDKFLIGRAKECALRAGSEAISRRHCAIVRANDGWTVRDLGSRNGTYVNDHRITEQVPLAPGDEVRVGPLKFRVAPGTASSTSSPVATPSINHGTGLDARPRKQPPVKDVADVVQRTINKLDDATTEDDVSRWLLGIPDAQRDAPLKETLSIRLEETSLSRAPVRSDTATVDDSADVLPDDPEQTPNDADSTLRADSGEKSGGWNLFRRGKTGAKKKPGKLPPRPDAPTKDSREAAADILREMTRRR
jgi:pSer/pThr/pTyr-binding forkhead associated (FHA) protein